MMHISPLEGRAEGRALHRVLIRFCDGIEARMEIRPGLDAIKNSDRGSQQAIDCPLQVLCRNRILESERRYLSSCVYSSVSTARACDVYRFAFKDADDFFQSALDGGKPRLHLPAVELCAVVGQGDSDSPRRQL